MVSIPQRRLGRHGPLVPAQGLGLMGLSMFYGKKRPDAERLAFLDYAYSVGCTNWDAADVYGDNEDLLGKWFRQSGKRRDIFLATKFGIVQHPGQPPSINNDPDYIRQACERSRSRLGLAADDPIDLYYCHRIDPNRPIEETVKVMAELQSAGKIKYLGLSECSANTLRRACKVAQIAAVQIEFSPFSTEARANGLVDACKELGVAIVAYSPLGRGMLSGAIKSYDDLDETDRRRILPRFSRENFPRNFQLVDKIRGLAQAKGCTANQLALLWVMAQGENFLAIPGTTKEANLDENLNSFKFTLTEKDKEEIEAILVTSEVVGDRHPAAMIPYLYVDTVAENK
ncbi:aldo-keto reductase, putative [Paecilomyces variotii No. 5]|uniref:Aldo-keto reductase, putative n=1 Tax=Byssochlamys spectabilis (strain No. 5 / NBRC 109023) TaxID=1356009 RepID=V5HTF5_BYSSN|nr:aldo-keto reductase, putative [Paecilomyces variotii No. 5]